MLRLLVALAAGAIFGFGLSMSGMVDPARVIGFLDLASGHWDPSLAFVLGGALLVALPGMALQRRMTRPALDDCFHLPTTTIIDPRLIAGSAVFGAGWGLAGFCPGPAVASLSIGLAPSFIFAIAMAAGMMLYDRMLAG
ncbi:YeeE/YedE family protein [[Pseudomonas] carboxydohydrogena]|uniref:YeeE/YedE family protein n=2 Tax=Afipia carboxydohydrogena TaxID=290 RepID=A0ABY8BQB9_AFICR|nr:YeeE/YedE family protein [[Pseudomonas] carboxydohydrogena]